MKKTKKMRARNMATQGEQRADRKMVRRDMKEEAYKAPACGPQGAWREKARRSSFPGRGASQGKGPSGDAEHSAGK